MLHLFYHRHRLLYPFCCCCWCCYCCSLRMVNLECQWMITGIIYQYVSGGEILPPPPPPPPTNYLWIMEYANLSMSLCVFATASFFFIKCLLCILLLSMDILLFLLSTFVPFHHLSTAVFALDCYIKKPDADYKKPFAHIRVIYISINKTNYASIELVIDFIIYF